MPLEVHPLEEADIPTFVQMQANAFKKGMAAYLVPKPVTPEWIQKSIEKHKKAFHNEPDLRFIKVVDTELGGKMIAGAKWRINEQDRTEEQFNAMLPVPGKDEEGNQAAHDFMWYLNRARREILGKKPFYFLHLLVTDPDHQGRGAGRLLVKWGTDGADKTQLPAYLEATEAGKPLYAKLGFVPRHEEVFDLSKYGAEGVDKNTVMIRDPPIDAGGP